MKNILSKVLIFVLFLGVGFVASIVSAKYQKPSGPVGSWSPILLSDVSDTGFTGFFKQGKLSVVSDPTVLETVPFFKNNQEPLVVPGLVNVDTFTGVYSNEIKNELPTTSNIPAFQLLDPNQLNTVGYIQQNPTNKQTKTLTVKDHLMVSRLFVGRNIDLTNEALRTYHLYVEPGNNPTTIGLGGTNNLDVKINAGAKSSYCTIGRSTLQDSSSPGCPTGTFLGKVVGMPYGSNPSIVGVCYDLVTSSDYSLYKDSQAQRFGDRGSCY